MTIQQSEIQLGIVGKPLNAYVASPSIGGPALLVLPSWWGLKPFFKRFCDRLAENGYTALALDYYNGRIGRTIEETQALQAEVEGDPHIMEGIVKAAQDHLTSIAPRGPIGVLGFSMGADWAVMTAANDLDVAATVLFYGYWTVDFSRMKSRVLGHYAETDEWQPFDGAKSMEQKMEAAGIDVTIHLYPGTSHWFMEEDRPEYNPAAASLAWERTLSFLKRSLGQDRGFA